MSAKTPSPQLPAVGSPTKFGGLFAGIVREEGADYAVFVGPEAETIMTFAEAQAWAKQARVHGFDDYTCGSRPQLALAYANLKDHFQRAPYWTNEQHAGHSNTAWFQDFDDGSQDYWLKNNELRARLVRRSPIQEFINSLVWPVA